MLRSVFLSLVAASTLERCIFDDFDIERALELEPQAPIDYALRYFLLKRFKMDNDTAVFTLLSAPDHNEYAGLLLACSNELGDHVVVTPDAKNTILRDVGRNVAEQFYENKYNFRDLIPLQRTVPPAELKDVIKNVWTDDMWIVSKFLFYIETRDIRLEDVIEEVKFLASKRDKQAMCLMGMVYLYGIGMKRDLEKALEYFWSCGADDNTQALVGIARVYMESELYNEESAIKHLEQALKAGSNAEASYCLYRIKKANDKNGTGDISFLKVSAYSGYLPAVYEYGVYLSEKGIVNSSNTSLASIVSYHPDLIKLDALAYNCFLKHKYKKAFLIYLFLSEFNISTATENAIFLIEKHSMFSDQNAVMCNVFKSLAKTEMKYNKHLGDCYLHGHGVKKSLLSAFSSYLSSRKFSEEGAYNTAVMHEYGLGVPQNLYEAKRIISKYVYSESSYLVRVYALARINLKILMYHHYLAAFAVTAVAILISTFFFIRGV